MAMLCFRAGFSGFVIHDRNVDVVSKRVVFIPLSGWRSFTRLDHSDREDSEGTLNFYRLRYFPPGILLLHQNLPYHLALHAFK